MQVSNEPMHQATAPGLRWSRGEQSPGDQALAAAVTQARVPAGMAQAHLTNSTTVAPQATLVLARGSGPSPEWASPAGVTLSSPSAA